MGGQSWRRGTKCDCQFDLLTFIFSFLCSGVDAKRGVKFRHSTRTSHMCLNTRFPLLLCAGYSVKLKLYSVECYY